MVHLNPPEHREFNRRRGRDQGEDRDEAAVSGHLVLHPAERRLENVRVHHFIVVPEDDT